MLMLHEIMDSSVEEEIVINSEDDGEIVLFAAVATFMRRDLNRNQGFLKFLFQHTRSMSLEVTLE